MPMITLGAQENPQVANLARGAPWHQSDKAYKGTHMSESIGARSLHLRIVDELRERIDSGAIAPGDPLPSTQALMDEFGVSSQTAQRAVRVLKTEGLVESIIGKGVFVKKRGDLVTRASSYKAPGTEGEDPLHRGTPLVTDLREVVPPADVARELGLAAGENAFLRAETWMVQRDPVEIVASYYRLTVVLGTVLAQPAPLPEDSISVLRSLGHAPYSKVEWTQTRMPTPAEARVLKLTSGTPVFRLLCVVHSEDDAVLEVSDTVLAGDRYQLRNELPIHA